MYFLPARRGTETAKKLRLISSTAGLFTGLEHGTESLNDFHTTIIGPETTDTAHVMDGNRSNNGFGLHLDNMGERSVCIRSRAFREGQISDGAEIRKVSARTADHYRAVPLSDGYHILFTDPRTGSLCLGIDAPVGSVTRLLRKVWFRPPTASTQSAVPILYAAGSDTRHGVRIVGAFPATQMADAMDGGLNEQVLVFFTVPPDLFHDLTGSAASGSYAANGMREERATRQSASEPWGPEDNYQPINIFNEPFEDSPNYPIEIVGQVIAVCNSLTDVALDSSPDMIIWAFGTSGWAKTWAVTSSSSDALISTAVQQDGAVRLIDDDGDVVMSGVE